MPAPGSNGVTVDLKFFPIESSVSCIVPEDCATGADAIRMRNARMKNEMDYGKLSAQEL